MTALIDLWFDLPAPNMQTEVFCLTSNDSKKLRSDFILLVFLTVTDGSGDIGML